MVLDGCRPEGLAALAQTSCDFIDDLSQVTITRQSPSATDQLGDKPAAATENSGDSTTSAPVEQPSAGSGNGAVTSSNSGTAEDKVCIAGAVSLKVRVEYVYDFI